MKKATPKQAPGAVPAPAAAAPAGSDSDSDDGAAAATLSVGICKQCHIAYSTYWPDMVKVELTCQPRFSEDADWAAFLNIIRQRRPTPEELRRYLSTVKHISKAQAMRLVSDKVRALCSHRSDVIAYNEAAVGNAFRADQLVDVPLLTNAEGVPELSKWLADPKFRCISKIAIGAHVALTSNICVEKGAANGSSGTVCALEYQVPVDVNAGGEEGEQRADQGGGERRSTWWGAVRGYARVVVTDKADIPANAGMLLAIHVKLDGGDGQPLRVDRTYFKRKYGHRKSKLTYIKSTFPLMLVSGWFRCHHACR